MLLLLQRGGEVVYFGESRVEAFQAYFEALPDAKSLPRGYNPATWILECVGVGVTRPQGKTPEFAQIFKSSSLCATMLKVLDEQQQNCERLVKLIFPRADHTSYQGINAGVGGVFFSLSYCGIVAINSALPLAVQDRAAFYRERSAQSYNALWYFVGGTLAEIPYIIISSFLFTALSFTIMGFTEGGDANWGIATIPLYWPVMAVFTLQQVYLGQFLAYALPGVELASLAGTLLSSILFLFTDFNPPSSAIPRGYRWLHILAPQRYTLGALVAMVFADCPSDSDRFGCHVLETHHLSCRG
ncbi:unnamed protein product [Phytophthora lilii]|uniref:Unnamed protein product n=1 Tax=Phytophthora lilii TaxID=2077276 RepID=A0A9W6TFD4_9STRA|nr:unnamed protein product [Phytophthora lilii]